MNPGESTHFRHIARSENPELGRDGAPTSDPWSTRAERFMLASLRPQQTPITERSPIPNNIDPATLRPERVKSAEIKPIWPRRPALGKRRFVPVYQWEGVVEEVNGGSFRARLVPFEDGQHDTSRVEYADFEYDDLADEDDLGRVAEGAVFYWTVGKSRNAAGTITNTSLVRFRRLPPPTLSQIREAARQAAELLADLGGE
jgi:hypothetical protein